MNKIEAHGKSWTEVISPRKSWFDLRLKELWEYRDLISLFVKRDFVTVYKQTILGPLWHFIQPLMTTLVFTIIFNRVAHISTDGAPPFLFYLSGLTIWNYFAKCLSSTSNTFAANAGVFGKVYFPRLTVPVSLIISALLSFSIQLFMFIMVYIYHVIKIGFEINVQTELALLPWLLFIMATLSLGIGIILSSLTTKYKDLRFLISFGVQLLMYATPVIYPLSTLHGRGKELMMYNPIAAVVEAFKYMFLGSGTFSYAWLGYATLVAVVIFFSGVGIFHKVEKTFMDTV